MFFRSGQGLFYFGRSRNYGRESALEQLRVYTQTDAGRRYLRTTLAGEISRAQVEELNDEQILEAVAALVAMGRLTLVQQRPYESQSAGFVLENDTSSAVDGPQNEAGDLKPAPEVPPEYPILARVQSDEIMASTSWLKAALDKFLFGTFGRAKRPTSVGRALLNLADEEMLGIQMSVRGLDTKLGIELHPSGGRIKALPQLPDVFKTVAHQIAGGPKATALDLVRSLWGLADVQSGGVRQWRSGAESSSSEEESATSETPCKTWFELRVVDEVREPVSGVDVVFKYGEKTETRKTDEDGRAKLEDVNAGTVSASLADVSCVRDILKSRWGRVRGGSKVAPAADVHVWHLREETPHISLQAEKPYTLSVQPAVVQATLQGGFFDTNKCFLLPTGVTGLCGIVSTYEKHAGSTMLIVGHTSTAGSDAANDVLSLERAKATEAYLTDNVEEWYKWYGSSVSSGKRWGTIEDQLMIDAMVDAAERSATEGRVRWFQRTRGLVVDGIAGKDTRRALIQAYMALDGTTLPDDIAVMTHGCGENFPRKDTGDGVEDADNRCVEVFFFEGDTGVLPMPGGENSAKGSEEYPEWVVRSREVVALVAEAPPKKSWPKIIIDAHMHVMSGSCTPLPAALQVAKDISAMAHLLGDTTQELNDNLSSGEGLMGSVVKIIKRGKIHEFGKVAAQSTYHIGKLTIKENDDIRACLAERDITNPLAGKDSLLFMSIVLPMDMDYCHIDGYDGKSVYQYDNDGWYYNERRLESVEPSAFLDPLRIALTGHEADDLEYERRDSKYQSDIDAVEAKLKEDLTTEERRELQDEKVRLGLERAKFQENQHEKEMNDAAIQEKIADLDKKRESKKTRNENNENNEKQEKRRTKKKRLSKLKGSRSKLYEDDDLGNIRVGIAKFETWNQQRAHTEKLLKERPFRLLSLYHYEPRRYISDSDPDLPLKPFEQITTVSTKQEGLYIGFKMYASLGYMPMDPNPKISKVLTQFFEKCSELDIPIMNHCTPDGFYTHERIYYIHHEIQRLEEEINRLQTEKNLTEEKEIQERLIEIRKFLDDDPSDWKVGAMRYFQEHYVHPEAWRPLLERFKEKNKELRVCLAHFASDPSLWGRFDIKELQRIHAETKGKDNANDPTALDMSQDDLDDLRAEAQNNVRMRFKNAKKTKRKDKKFRKYWRKEIDKIWAKNPERWGKQAKPVMDEGHGKIGKVVYRHCWIRSLISLCCRYKNFYVDISYLKLWENGTWEKLVEIIKLYPDMLKKIMFGTDWYMIRTQDSYIDWFKKAIEYLQKMNTALRNSAKLKNVNLFFQFAIVNPFRFYRLPEVAPLFYEALKKAIDLADDSICKSASVKELEKHYKAISRFITPDANPNAVLDEFERDIINAETTITFESTP